LEELTEITATKFYFRFGVEMCGSELSFLRLEKEGKLLPVGHLPARDELDVRGSDVLFPNDFGEDLLLLAHRSLSA